MKKETLSLDSSIAEIRVSEDGENRLQALAVFLSDSLDRKVNPAMLMLAKNVTLKEFLRKLNIYLTADVEEMMKHRVLY